MRSPRPPSRCDPLQPDSAQSRAEGTVAARVDTSSVVRVQFPSLSHARAMTKKTRVGRFSAEGCGLWTKEEHQRFLDALKLYPNGPWKKVSELVGTRTPRQTMTHAQKYKQKLARHERGLRTRKKQEDAMAGTPPVRNAPQPQWLATPQAYVGPVATGPKPQDAVTDQPPGYTVTMYHQWHQPRHQVDAYRQPLAAHPQPWVSHAMLEPLPLAPGENDPRWMADCYDLLVGAPV